MTTDSSQPMLEVQDLRVYYGQARRPVRAVDGVSFSLRRGEALGLVGESGCGKSTLGRALLRLEPIHSGRVLLDGVDMVGLRGAKLKAFRGRAQMIFQDPYGSLNPRHSVGGMLREAVAAHRRTTSAERDSRVAELLRAVGLDPAYTRRYPHEFSGGQRQRLGLARALAVKPDMIIADEPVSALDVSVQVQILNLLKDLQQQLNLALLFIAHDLAVVRYVCDRILVMYLGKVVESSPAPQLFAQPRHPYSEALLSAVPDVAKGLAARTNGSQKRIVLHGDMPSPAQTIPGCPFHPRCHRARERCKTEVPALRAIEPGHCSACHFAEEL
ncbi:MAG: ATP-binding cassette domain-containing protein [Kiritimatiellaeota bacterium]|nr:ATP-binding cassette domain-containing protein [Kiritimatiellota bacterium]